MREVFNTFWHGRELCPIAIACMNSFVYHGHSLNLYTYENIVNAGKHIALKDASLILPRDRIYLAHGGFESLSDVFRYKLLLQEGGWWVDTDVVCNSSSIKQADVAFAREGRGEKFANGQIKFTRGHPIIREAVRYLDSNPDTGWGTTGPVLLTRLIQEAHMEEQRWPTNDFYPIFWAESAKFLLPEYRNELIERTCDSPFTHIYTSRFRRRLQFDQSRFLPPKGSYLELLYLTYGAGPSLTNLTPVDEQSLRSCIYEHMNEGWIREYLSSENVEFAMQNPHPILEKP
ncbi:glycosyltransferase [Beijerinckia sp. L45]|uniref:glycosyltransferase n=1 Tax=Beijerinckia sp. L45 TaxID=1641855 RepID=UPI00131E6946|nr:glycosyltransferase [Beijerinckia sp. L45]